MWSVFIVKFLISARSLDGFSPFFFPCSSQIPRRAMSAAGAPASPCFPLPRQPRSLAASLPSSEQTHWELTSSFCSLAAFPHLPVLLGIRLTSAQQFPPLPASPRCFLKSPVRSMPPLAATSGMLCKGATGSAGCSHHKEPPYTPGLANSGQGMQHSTHHALGRSEVHSGFMGFVAALVFHKFLTIQFDLPCAS